MGTLSKLRVDFNLLESLPLELGRLEKLEVLTASNNIIRHLPHSLFHLTEKLQILQVNDNKIKRLSHYIGNLRKLKVLLLHNNLLRTLPSEIM